MATPYTVDVRLSAPEATSALAGVLRQALADDEHDDPAEVTLTAAGDPEVLVTTRVATEDASIAQLDAQRRVRDALRRAGIDDSGVSLDDVTVRTDS
jgi:hypothetical protein